MKIFLLSREHEIANAKFLSVSFSFIYPKIIGEILKSRRCTCFSQFHADINSSHLNGNLQYIFIYRLVLLREVPILQSEKEIESFINKHKGTTDIIFSFQKAIGTYGNVDNKSWFRCGDLISIVNINNTLTFVSSLL